MQQDKGSNHNANKTKYFIRPLLYIYICNVSQTHLPSFEVFINKYKHSYTSPLGLRG